MGLHMAHQILPGEAFDIGHRADHRHAHGVVAPDGAVQQIAGAVLRVLFVLDGLLPDHLQLPLQLMLGKHAVQHDVRNHSQQGLRMPAQAGHEIAGDVLAGEGVDLRAQPLRIQVDLLHGTRVRAFERHVFQHMADPLLVEVSSREPTRRNTPTLTLCKCGMGSASSRTPFARVRKAMAGRSSSVAARGFS